MAQGKDLGALIGQIGADLRQWEKAVRQMENDLKGVENRGEKATKNISASFDRMGKRMVSAGRTMTRRVTLPLVGLGAAAVKTFGDFDAAMTQSLAIMGDVSDALQKDMTDAARQVARTTTLSAKEAAESYFFLASAGLDAQQSIAALPQVAAFAQAGMFDMATATDLATDAQSALGLTVDNAAENLENMTRVTDVLVKANTLANATVEQFSQSLTREAGAALKSFDKDIEEGVAVLAAFADQGVKGEKAGSDFARVVRRLTQAANDNSEAMDRLGIRVFDSQGKMRNMADIIADLEMALGDMSDQQRTAALQQIGFTARLQGAILPLLGTSDAIREYEGNLRSASGVTQDVADNQLQAFNEQLSLLWDNIKDVGISIGQTLEPVLRRLVNLTQRGAEMLQGMSESTRQWTVLLGGVATAIGPMLVGLGGILKISARLLTPFKGILKVFRVLRTAMLALLSPIGLKIAALAALALIGKSIWDTFEPLREFFRKLWDGIARSFQTAINFIIRAWNKVKDFVGQIVPGITATVVESVEWMNEQTQGKLGEFAGNVEQNFNDALAFVTGFVSDAQDSMAEWWGSLAGGPPSGAGGGAGGGGRPENPLEVDGDPFRRIQQGWQQMAQPDMSNLTEVPDKAMSKWEKFSTRFQEIGGEFQSFLSGQISEAVLSFGEALGRSIAGAENTWQTTFEKILLVVVDFAQSLAKLAAGIGAVMLFIPGMQGTGAGLLAAAGALTAATTAIKVSIDKKAQRRQEQAQLNGQKVNDALITAEGKVIEFASNDDILAMPDMKKRMAMSGGAMNGGASGGKQEFHLYIDGREIEVALAERKYKKEL